MPAVVAARRNLAAALPALLAAAAVSGCGDNWELIADAGLDAASEVCPAPGTVAFNWHYCFEFPEKCPAQNPGIDDDGDGAGEAEGDCNDRDVFVGPGADEVCDLRDNDCDGDIDEGACADPATACPLSFAEARCCGATSTVAGQFYEPDIQGSTPATTPAADGSYTSPFEVLIRHRVTGEMRRAITCPAPPRTNLGYGYRFMLEDAAFVRPGEQYELLIHLRWYFPDVADPWQSCLASYPSLTTDLETSAVCVDYGALALWCL
jgi:hypothetical protein